MGDLSGTSEFVLIQMLSELCPFPEGGVGIGDDCSVIPWQQTSILLTTDTMVENRHFRRSWSSPQQIGEKLLAVNLSDIAAMGGVPATALISLQLPSDVSHDWVCEVYAGIRAAAITYGVSVSGGNTVAAPTLSLSATLIGYPVSAPILRGGLMSDDDIWVSGTIGLAGLGLALLGGQDLETAGTLATQALLRHRAPTPRLWLGKTLAERKLATAMIDVSDGLFQDLSHLVLASRLSVEIDLALIPIPQIDGDLKPQRCNEVRCGLAASAGDDYELLFSAPRVRRAEVETLASEEIALTRIGRVCAISDSAELWVTTPGRAPERMTEFLSRIGVSGGFDHFSS